MARWLVATWLAGFRVVAQNLGPFLGIAGVVVLWVGLQHSATAERRQALLGASQNTANLARAFEEHTIRSLKAIDQSLMFIRQAVARNPQGFDVVTWARETQSLTDMTFQISRIDRNGILASSNFAPNGNGIDLSDREHFRVQRDSADDDLFVSKPVLGRASNKWSIQLTRKVIAADGSFDGVIVVSLDPFILSRFYNSVDLGGNGMILLAGTDGVVRASGSGSAGGDVGRSIAGTPLFDAFMQQWSGTRVGPASLDGVRRIESFRGVVGYPLFVSVGIAEDDVLAVQRVNARTDGGLGGVMTVLLLAVTGVIVWRQHVLGRARVALRASQMQFAQKSHMLETTLEAMSQGILMVDADRHAQVCNQRALDLLGLTEPVSAGQKLPESMARALDDMAAVMPQDAARDGQAPRPELVSERLLENGMVLEVRTRFAGGRHRADLYRYFGARRRGGDPGGGGGTGSPDGPAEPQRVWAEAGAGAACGPAGWLAGECAVHRPRSFQDRQ
jgi:PAS domain-containing protein